MAGAGCGTRSTSPASMYCGPRAWLQCTARTFLPGRSAFRGGRVQVNLFVLVGCAGEGRDPDPIEVHDRFVVVLSDQSQPVQLHRPRPLERASQPDVGGGPAGADGPGRDIPLAETARSLPPTAVVEVESGPALGRLLDGVAPVDRLLVGGRGDRHDCRRCRWGREEAFVGGPNRPSVHLDHGAVVGHQAVDLDLDVGRLRVDRRRQPGLADERVQLVDQPDVGRRSGLPSA